MNVLRSNVPVCKLLVDSSDSEQRPVNGYCVRRDETAA